MSYLELEKDDISEEDVVERVTVPDIRGKSVKEAKEILKEEGLILELKEEKEISGEDIVKNQTPMSGIEINKGSKVYYEI